MNEALSAMILSLLENSNRHVTEAGTNRSGGAPDCAWTAHMVTAMLLKDTAEALRAAREKLR
jgi:hypothetical protein